jgi:DnaK suppressor protein
MAAKKQSKSSRKVAPAAAKAKVKPAVKASKVKAAPAKAPAGKNKPAATSLPPIRPSPLRPAPVAPIRPSGARPINPLEPPTLDRKISNRKHFTAKEIKEYKQLLLNLRDRVVDEINFLAGDNLNRSQRESSGDLSSYSFHMADQGTDNFDREFALNLVSSEQDALYEIDEALRRIDNHTYGMCELSGEPIEKERLKVLPFARYSVRAQSEMERGKTRFRPFGPTLSHASESS